MKMEFQSRLIGLVAVGVMCAGGIASVAEDEKGVKITRLDGIYTEDSSLTQTSAVFKRGENSSHILFEHLYIYFMYDQYRKLVKISEKGGAIPMIKENFGAHSSPFLKLRSALNDWTAKYEAIDWHPPSTDAAFGDFARLAINEDCFRIDSTSTGEFVPGIKNGRQVFSVLNHKWWGSINKTNIAQLTDNSWSGKVVNVVYDIKKKVIKNFQVETTYIVKTKYNR